MFGWLSNLFNRQPKRRDYRSQPEVAKAESRRSPPKQSFMSMIAGGAGGQRQDKARWTIDRQSLVDAWKGSVYIAVGAIARRVAMQEVQVFARRRDKSGEKFIPVPDDHPLKELFGEVNDVHTQYDLWFYMMTWRLVTGDSYLWKVRNGLRMPAALWPLPSQWVHVMPGRDRMIEAYLVRKIFGGDATLPSDDVIHIQEPSIDWRGGGMFYGRSPSVAADHMIDIEQKMLKQLLARFQNLAPPGLHYETERELSEEELTQYYQQIAAQHMLAEQTGRPVISHGGLKLKDNMMASPKEMDYRGSLASALDYTLAVYGVPHAIVGLVRDVNRSSFDGSLTTFSENTINPLLVHTSQHLTQDLARDFDDDLVIELPKIEVKDIEGLRKNMAEAMRSGAATPNEYREVILGMPPYKTGGDRPLVQGSMSEASFGNDNRSPSSPPPDDGQDLMPDGVDTDKSYGLPSDLSEADVDALIDRLFTVTKNGQPAAAPEVAARFFYAGGNGEAGRNGQAGY